MAQRYFRDLASSRIGDAHSLVSGPEQGQDYGLTSEVSWFSNELLGQSFAEEGHWELGPADAEGGQSRTQAHFSGFRQYTIVWMASNFVAPYDWGSGGGQNPQYGVVLGRHGRLSPWEIVQIIDDSP